MGERVKGSSKKQKVQIPRYVEVVRWIFLFQQIESADACLILANKYCADPDAEDASNIMRYRFLWMENQQSFSVWR